MPHPPETATAFSWAGAAITHRHEHFL